ncbi:MAG: SMP-30/gluconolactonase/LRE family protein [Candidatus Marinimicrobia bacterium]|nr:SMP-30/gluconolactonase/LRE family protein [Candidatus Neomarinimicrobiota bacterium]
MIKNKLKYSILLPIIFLLFSFCDKAIVDENAKWELIASDLNFPEGPVWNNNTLYFSSCFGGWIGKIENGQLDTFLTASKTTFSNTNGLIIDKDANIIAVEYGIGKLLKISTDDKSVVVLSDGYNGKYFNHPNDLTFDNSGNIYFSDPKSYGRDILDGRVFYYDSKLGKVKLVADSLAYPNGIAISPIDNKLYLSESAKNRVLSFDILENGNLKNKKEFIQLPGGDPDGLDFDKEGNLFVAHFGTGTVFIISQDGTILKEIKTPGEKPSNIEFGGKDLRTLFVTEDETNSIYKIITNTQGYKK